MSDDQLTPNEFLRLNKSEIEDLFEKVVPQSKGKPDFAPNDYIEPAKPVLAKIKKWKLAYVAKATERKSILNWVVPLLLVGPGLISIIAGGFTHLTAILFSGGTVLIVGVLWFYGRIWAWESKHYEENTENAERSMNRVIQKRAKEWAEARYDMNTEYIEWSEFSNFYIEGKAYRWKEQEQDGHYLIVEVDTDEEVPRLEEESA